jgi:MazG family protein
MAQERGAFSFDDVAAAICNKMERRHPHVFGDAHIADAAAQNVAWEELKQRERAQSSAAGKPTGVLDDVPIALPALTRASKLGKRAAQVGFEWPDILGALDKVREEIDELRHEIRSDASTVSVEQEIGDVLFSVVNVSRYLKVDPERALRGTNSKFERRFRFVEDELRGKGRTPQQATLEEMDVLWDEAKRQGL